MPQIVNKSYFNKQNILYIPLASEAPLPSAVTSTPNDGTYIDALCIEIEKTILVNALGLTTYNELQLALADIDNPLNASYKKLVNGDEYDGKIWVGLKYDLSLIANAVWIEYVMQKNTNLSAVGNSQVNLEKGNLVTPMYKIANASASFIKQYQGEYLNEPYVNGIFVDWLGNNEGVYVSLYRIVVKNPEKISNIIEDMEASNIIYTMDIIDYDKISNDKLKSYVDSEGEIIFLSDDEGGVLLTTNKLEDKLRDLKKAFSKLKESASRNPDDDIVIDATIQRFEFTYELSWKLMKAYLEYNGNLEATSPRKAIKESFKEGLIEDGAQWLDMLQDRNRTSHTYDENCAIEIFNNIKEVIY